MFRILIHEMWVDMTHLPTSKHPLRSHLLKCLPAAHNWRHGAALLSPLLLQDLVNLQTIHGWHGDAGARAGQQQLSAGVWAAGALAERCGAGPRARSRTRRVTPAGLCIRLSIHVFQSPDFPCRKSQSLSIFIEPWWDLLTEGQKERKVSHHYEFPALQWHLMKSC